MDDQAAEPSRRWILPCATALSPLALWGILLFAVPPAEQEFPLHDDCFFSRTAFTLARGDGLRYYNFASMPLLGQLLWALPFVWLLGESQVALRLSTLTLAGVGLVAFADLLRSQGKWPATQAALAAACLAVNPLFFLLAITFHTDVPALSLSLAGLALYARGLLGCRRSWWYGGMALALLAVLTRQNTVAVPLAAAVALGAEPRVRTRLSWWVAVVLPILAAVLGHLWFQRRADAWPLQPQFALVALAPVVLFVAVHFLGLSALPLLLWRSPGSWGGFLAILLVLLAGALLLRTVPIYPFAELFPYLGNWLTPWGQFDEGNVLPGQRPLLLGPVLRSGLTVAGCVAGASLCADALYHYQAGKRPGLLAFFTFFQVPFLFAVPWLFDRYLLVLLPGGIAAVGAARASRFRSLAALAGLVLFALVSLGLAHDFLAWNRAAWVLGRRAVVKGIAVEDIEGGFAWDGWFAPEASRVLRTQPGRGLTIPFAHERYPAATGRYAVSFSVLPSSRVLDEEPYRLWLIPGERRMYFVEDVSGP